MNTTQNQTDISDEFEEDQAYNSDTLQDEPQQNEPTTFSEKINAIGKNKILLGIFCLSLFIILFGISGYFVHKRQLSLTGQPSESQDKKIANDQADSLAQNPDPSDGTVPEILDLEIASPSAKKSGQASPTPTPLLKPATPKPTATPTPVPQNDLANLFFYLDLRPFAQEIIESNKQAAPSGQITESGTSFYYLYEMVAEPFSSGSTLKQGTKVSDGFTIKNDGKVRSKKTQVLVNVTGATEGNLLNKNTTIEIDEIGSGETISSGTVSFLPQTPGNFTITYTLDQNNSLAESNENDNIRSFSYTISPDSSKPYLAIYPEHLETTSENGPHICYDFRATFCRDDQDATVESGPSTHTQLRFNFQDQWTDWTAYTELNNKFSKTCISAEPGKKYEVTVQCKDRSGNTSELKIDRTY